MLQCLGVIVAGIASDMCHQHPHALNLEEAELVIYSASITTVNITIYGTQRFELRNLIGKLQ